MRLQSEWRHSFCASRMYFILMSNAVSEDGHEICNFLLQIQFLIMLEIALGKTFTDEQRKLYSCSSQPLLYPVAL